MAEYDFTVSIDVDVPTAQIVYDIGSQTFGTTVTFTATAADTDTSFISAIDLKSFDIDGLSGTYLVATDFVAQTVTFDPTEPEEFEIDAETSAYRYVASTDFDITVANRTWAFGTDKMTCTAVLSAVGTALASAAVGENTLADGDFSSESFVLTAGGLWSSEAEHARLYVTGIIA